MRKKWMFFSFVIFFLAISAFLFLVRPFAQKDPFSRVYKDLQSLMKPQKTDDMNIVLFTIDTLRADHLECYGYKEIKTPNINRMADEGALFQYAIIQTPLTLPSHSSIMTGTYPLYHGVRDNGGFYLDENQTTLAETLKSKGYRTAAFVGAFVLDSRWGLDQGFDYYFDNFDLTKYKTVSLDAVQRRGDEVLGEATKWIQGNLTNRFFTWIHLYDPHTPYDPPEPFRSQYSGQRFGLYDGEIAYVDRLLGEFQEFLEKQGLWDKTVVILTGDHGESLGEHKESAHGFFIYEACTRVPLIIRFPAQKLSNIIITRQVQSIDIMPTILHFANLLPPESVQGKSLLSLMMGKNEENEHDAYSETFWPRFHYGWSELRLLRRGQFKFIDAPRPELYDLLADPEELVNIVDQKAALAHEMKRDLDKLIEEFSGEGIEGKLPERLDDDSLIKLRALGYIGSFRTSAKKKGEKLADPKDRIELYNEIKLTQFMVAEDKNEQAIIKIQNVLNQDPSVLEALYILGNIFSKEKRYEEAIAEYKKALEIDPEYYDAIFGLAMAYKNSGKADEAILGFQRLTEIDPRDTKPLLNLADIFDEREDLDQAENYLVAGTRLDPESPVFHNKLGAVYLKKGMLDEAENEIKAALSIERHVPLLNAHFNMALLHEAKGKMSLAIEEYKKEQETAPYNYKPDFNLGLLYADSQELESAIKEFESCISKNPDFADVYAFLAKAYMDKGEDLDHAVQLAKKALDLRPKPRTEILAHFVLADLYNRLGQLEEAKKHISKAQELQSTLLKAKR
jgi:arylsulfatase A-like enzyme/Tfp pilus assembly protein PilF